MARESGKASADPAAELLRSYLADPESSFSIGVSGAIAEFLRRHDEPIEPLRLGLATSRGGIRFAPEEGLKIRALESLGKRALSWQQEVVFVLPRPLGQMSGRDRLTELGPDEHALLHRDRRGVLFDLGIGAESLDFCIRTLDLDLIAELRAVLGRSLFEPGNPATQSIRKASPHRVAISRLGRIEVYQPIGQEETPDGPHTHLLPHLLERGACGPGASLYPAHPLQDLQGREMPFEPRCHDAFQRLLRTWGQEEHLKEKARVLDALAADSRPEDYVPPKSAKGMAALRIALRQQHWVAGGGGRLGDWLGYFDAEYPLSQLGDTCDR